MSFNLSSPVTGATITGLTTPTFTLTVDVAPSVNGKQFAVTQLGGTQTGSVSHSVSNPFTIAGFRPAVLKTLPQANPVTGVIKNIPFNNYKLLTRKGLVPALNQAPIVSSIQTTWALPAGAETFDLVNFKSALSAHIGALWASANELANTSTTGII